MEREGEEKKDREKREHQQDRILEELRKDREDRKHQQDRILEELRKDREDRKHGQDKLLEEMSNLTKPRELQDTILENGVSNFKFIKDTSNKFVLLMNQS